MIIGFKNYVESLTNEYKDINKKVNLVKENDYSVLKFNAIGKDLESCNKISVKDSNDELKFNMEVLIHILDEDKLMYEIENYRVGCRVTSSNINVSNGRLVLSSVIGLHKNDTFDDLQFIIECIWCTFENFINSLVDREILRVIPLKGYK